MIEKLGCELTSGATNFHFVWRKQSNGENAMSGAGAATLKQMITIEALYKYNHSDNHHRLFELGCAGRQEQGNLYWSFGVEQSQHEHILANRWHLLASTKHQSWSFSYVEQSRDRVLARCFL